MATSWDWYYLDLTQWGNNVTLAWKNQGGPPKHSLPWRTIVERDDFVVKAYSGTLAVRFIVGVRKVV